MTIYFFLGKIGYHQSFAKEQQFPDMPVLVPGEFKGDSDPGDGWYDYRMAWDAGGWKNWFPYFKLTDCEALCRTTSNCVAATYIKDRDAYGGPKTAHAMLHGECFLHSGTPDVVYDSCPNCADSKCGGVNCDANQMTITKRDTGRLNCLLSFFMKFNSS